MIFKNITGQSYKFFPENLANPNLGSVPVASKTISGKVIFFGGTYPTQKQALNIIKSDLEDPSKFVKLMETETFNINITYDTNMRKRMIRKETIDAQELFYLNAGTITWAAIVLDNASVSVDHLIFTETIGMWGAVKSPIILDNKTGTVGSRNLFKNLSLEIGDKIVQL